MEVPDDRASQNPTPRILLDNNFIRKLKKKELSNNDNNLYNTTPDD